MYCNFIIWPYYLINFNFFQSNFKLKRHMSVHTGVKQHKCERCGKQYLDLASLRNHIYQVFL